MYFSFPINEESRIYKQLEYFHLLVEFIFISDFILTFFQAFQHKETYEIITDYKKIAINYVNGWFIIDLVCIFPFQFILVDPSQAQTVKLARLCRIPRLAKLINVERFKSILKSFEKEQGDDKVIMK